MVSGFMDEAGESTHNCIILPLSVILTRCSGDIPVSAWSASCALHIVLGHRPRSKKIHSMSLRTLPSGTHHGSEC